MIPHLSYNAVQSYTAHLQLDGTVGNPNNASNLGTAPDTKSCGWIFNTDGTVDRENISGTNEWGDTQEPNQWMSIRSGQTVRDVHLKFTKESGTTAATVTPAVGTWGKIMGASGASLGRLQWVQVGQGFQDGIYKVELSLDGGTTVHQTGYYQGTVTVESGL